MITTQVVKKKQVLQNFEEDSSRMQLSQPQVLQLQLTTTVLRTKLPTESHEVILTEPQVSSIELWCVKAVSNFKSKAQQAFLSHFVGPGYGF